MGISIEFSQESGRMPYLSINVKRLAREYDHHSVFSFRRSAGIPSGPGALLVLRDLIRSTISSCVTGGQSGASKTTEGHVKSQEEEDH